MGGDHAVFIHGCHLGLVAGIGQGRIVALVFGHEGGNDLLGTVHLHADAVLFKMHACIGVGSGNGVQRLSAANVCGNEHGRLSVYACGHLIGHSRRFVYELTGLALLGPPGVKAHRLLGYGGNLLGQGNVGEPSAKGEALSFGHGKLRAEGHGLGVGILAAAVFKEGQSGRALVPSCHKVEILGVIVAAVKAKGVAVVPAAEGEAVLHGYGEGDGRTVGNLHHGGAFHGSACGIKGYGVAVVCPAGGQGHVGGNGPHARLHALVAEIPVGKDKALSFGDGKSHLFAVNHRHLFCARKHA